MNRMGRHKKTEGCKYMLRFSSSSGKGENKAAAEEEEKEKGMKKKGPINPDGKQGSNLVQGEGRPAEPPAEQLVDPPTSQR